MMVKVLHHRYLHQKTMTPQHVTWMILGHIIIDISIREQSSASLQHVMVLGHVMPVVTDLRTRRRCTVYSVQCTLCRTALHCTTLNHSALKYTTLDRPAINSTSVNRAELNCTTLSHAALNYTRLDRLVLNCTKLEYATLNCTLRCAALHQTLHYTKVR